MLGPLCANSPVTDFVPGSSATKHLIKRPIFPLLLSLRMSMVFLRPPFKTDLLFPRALSPWVEFLIDVKVRSVNGSPTEWVRHVCSRSMW